MRNLFIHRYLNYFWAIVAISSPTWPSNLSHAHSIACIALPQKRTLRDCLEPISYLPVRRTERLATYAVPASRIVVRIFVLRKPAFCSNVVSEPTVKIRRCLGGSRWNQEDPYIRWPAELILGVTTARRPPGFRMRRHSLSRSSGSWTCSIK